MVRGICLNLTAGVSTGHENSDRISRQVSLLVTRIVLGSLARCLCQSGMVRGICLDVMTGVSAGHEKSVDLTPGISTGHENIVTISHHVSLLVTGQR